MKKIFVTDKDTLQELYEDSALTIEGLAEESIPDLLDWIKQFVHLKSETVYVIKGEIMNIHYHLTGSNAYPDDLNIVSVKLSDMENPEPIFLPRFNIGGRWFDDIVDNNSRRESEN